WKGSTKSRAHSPRTMLSAAPAADGLSQRRRSDARRIRDDTGGPPFSSAKSLSNVSCHERDKKYSTPFPRWVLFVRLPPVNQDSGSQLRTRLWKPNSLL